MNLTRKQLERFARSCTCAEEFAERLAGNLTLLQEKLIEAQHGSVEVYWNGRRIDDFIYNIDRIKEYSSKEYELRFKRRRPKQVQKAMQAIEKWHQMIEHYRRLGLRAEFNPVEELSVPHEVYLAKKLDAVGYRYACSSPFHWYQDKGFEGHGLELALGNGNDILVQIWKRGKSIHVSRILQRRTERQDDNRILEVLKQYVEDHQLETLVVCEGSMDLQEADQRTSFSAIYSSCRQEIAG